jgi:hypothetical protein
MRRCVLFVLAVSLTVPVAGLRGQDKGTPPAAKVVVTADLVCLHCDLGIGDGCVPGLMVGKTPVQLAGKVVTQFEKDTFDKKVVVVDGVLTLDNKKQFVLASDKGTFHTPDNKSAPAKGSVRVTGMPVCGSCDLMLCDECTLAVANGSNPIILDGKLAQQHRADGVKTAIVDCARHAVP